MFTVCENRNEQGEKGLNVISITLALIVLANLLGGCFLLPLQPGNYFTVTGEIKQMEEQVAENRDSVEKLRELGVSYYKIKKYDKAEEVLKKAAALDRDSLSALYSLSMVYMDEAKFDQAINCLKKITFKSPRHFQSTLNIGKAYYKKGDYKNAEAYLNRALQLEPGSSEVGYYLVKLKNN